MIRKLALALGGGQSNGSDAVPSEFDPDEYDPDSDEMELSNVVPLDCPFDFECPGDFVCEGTFVPAERNDGRTGRIWRCTHCERIFALYPSTEQ